MENFIKKSKIFFRIILILIILLLTYIITFNLFRLNSESLITSDFYFLLQTKNVNKLFNKLDESNLLNTVFYNRELKDINKILFDIKMQMSKTKRFIINLVDFPCNFYNG